MGKTSLLNHLVGRPDEYLLPQPGQPPLVLACLDLQAGVTNKERFYGRALRELLDHLSAGQKAQAGIFQDWRERLHARPEASYDELEEVLRRLRDPRDICVRRYEAAAGMLDALRLQPGEFGSALARWSEIISTGLEEARRQQCVEEPIPQVYISDGRPARPSERPELAPPF